MSDAIVSCGRCGEPLWSAATRDQRPTHCPQCGEPVPPPASRKAKAKSSEQIKPALPEVFVRPLPDAPPPTDENAEEYRFSEQQRFCPKCKRELPGDGVLCVACGYNAETGEQAKREYTPVQRTWEGALSLRRRLLIMGAAQFLTLLALPGAFVGDIVLAWFISWCFFTPLLAYILGTFDRIDLTRNRRGDATMTRTWRIAFIPMPKAEILLWQYSGVRCGATRDIDVMDWFLFGSLLAAGVIPGLIWWYLAFHKDMLYVTLLKEHGTPALELYRGWNEAQAREMAQIIQDVAGYR
jgi:hypothetical protein